ncbi:hypothetical protein VNO78_34275 [Psophocarpus tetragonolobus]|uniref:Uncharacterized protein n=1 Tax=Psophocarpus tetragonolobus TaxID=3891 RepID=A0AAN9RPX5_PSOTE
MLSKWKSGYCRSSSGAIADHSDMIFRGLLRCVNASNGKYSVKAAYKLIVSRSSIILLNPEFKLVRKLHVPPKVKCMIW